MFVAFLTEDVYIKWSSMDLSASKIWIAYQQIVLRISLSIPKQVWLDVQQPAFARHLGSKRIIVIRMGSLCEECA